MGLTWINRLGVVTLVFGVAFFFKYAVESGWIGVGVRVLLGIAVGLAAIALGERIWRGGQVVYAQGITSVGLGILYLSFYAAFALYSLIPQASAFVFMALTTAGAGALALRYDALPIALFGMFGGYVTPPLLAGREDHPWFLYGYLLLLGLVALYLARVKHWLSPLWLAFSATALLYAHEMRTRRAVDTIFGLAWYALFSALDLRWMIVAVQVFTPWAIAYIWGPGLWPFVWIELALVCAGLFTAARFRRPLAVAGAFAGFWVPYAIWYTGQPRPLGPVLFLLTAVFLLFLGWMAWRAGRLGVLELTVLALNGGLYFGTAYFVLQPAWHDWTGGLAVAVALAHIGLAYLIWRRDQRTALLAAGVAWVFVVLAAPIQFSGYRITMAWALEGAALAWIGARAREQRAKLVTLAVFVLVLLRLDFIDTWIGTPADYVLIFNARLLTFLVAAASFWLAAWWIREGGPALFCYVGGHFVLLWALGLEAIDWAARSALPENLRSAQSVAISILMACYAVGLVAIGVARGSGLNRLLGLGLIGIVIVKLYLYDVWFLSLFFRMSAFAVLGALLLVMSYLYSRFRPSIESWWRER